MLAKCSAKEEHLERRKDRFDIVDYSHMSIGEVLSGYLSQVHSSHDVEIDMVKQMHHNLRYNLLCSLNHPYYASPQVYCL